MNKKHITFLTIKTNETVLIYIYWYRVHSLTCETHSCFELKGIAYGISLILYYIMPFSSVETQEDQE
jgi:hypothetical protein